MSAAREIAVADVIRRAIRDSYTRLVEHEAAVRAGDDPESIHQARVACRRLRSDLRTFEDFVDGHWSDDLRAELRWLGSELGAVRDIEVQRERLRANAARLPTTDAEVARRVLRRLDADRAAARADLLTLLSEPHYGQVRAKLAAAAASPVFLSKAHDDARKELTPVVRRRWKKVRRAVQALGTNPPDDALHAVRIRAKRCRYAADACEPALGPLARRLAYAMERVQDVLGEHHDAVVATAWLAKTAHECTPAEAYAIGMLAQLEREAQAETRARFSGVWARADTKRVRGWL